MFVRLCPMSARAGHAARGQTRCYAILSLVLAVAGRIVALSFSVAIFNIAGAKDKGAEKAPEDGVKKPSRRREVWTEQEHANFVEGLQIHHRNWKEVAAHVGTKTVVQVRSHAQKWFIRMQKKGRGDMIPPTNSELKHQQALRAAQADPSIARASTGNPTDGAGDSLAPEHVLPSQLRPSQDCTSQCAAKRPAPAAHVGSPMTVTVAPQHRQPAATPEMGQSAAAATPRAAAAAPAAAAPPAPPMSPEAMQAHSQPPHVMCSMPYADSCGAQPGMARWAAAGAYQAAAPPDSGGHAGGVYVVRPVAEPVVKAPPQVPKKEPVAEKFPEMVQPGLVSSLLEPETTSAPRAGTGPGRPGSKPTVDYASVYKFLATCFDLTNTWQGLLAGLTQMPNKERQMTVTLMGRMLNQMESRMQHTRGTAPPGWADLHHAAKVSGASKDAMMEPEQPEAAPQEPSAAPASRPPTPRRPAPAPPAANGTTPQQPRPQQPHSSTCDDRGQAQLHAPGDAARPSQVAAADPTMRARLWVQSSGPGMPGDPAEEGRPWPDVTPQMAAVDIAAAHHAPVPQRSPLQQPVSAMPCDQLMSDAPPAGYPVQGPASTSLPDSQRDERARPPAVTAPEQPRPESRQLDCTTPQQQQSSLGARGPHALPPGTPPAGDVRTTSFRSLMPAMHGQQSLAARAAFDARFDARMASAAMHGPRMADVQVHGSRPAAQQMIPTPVLPPEAQAEMDSRKANGSSGAEDTAGPPVAASATAADYLMGAVLRPVMDSCMEGDGDEPLRPPMPPASLGRRPGGLMWMSAAECGDAVPQSAGHSATVCPTDSAWTAVANSSAEPSMAMGFTAWQQGWPGGPPTAMGMHGMPARSMMQQHQMQRDEIGELLMADDADVALLGGSDMAMDMCMPHMHDEPMLQQTGMGAPVMSPVGGQGQMIQGLAGKPMQRFRGVAGGQDGGGNPVHELAQGDWMQERRPRQQQMSPWAAGPPAV